MLSKESIVGYLENIDCQDKQWLVGKYAVSNNALELNKILGKINL